MIDVKSIEKVLDFDWCMTKIRPVTPYGVEYKKAMKPYPVGSEKFLRESLESLESFVTFKRENTQDFELENLLSMVKDVRYSIARARDNQVLSEVELFEIKSLLFLINNINKLVKTKKIPVYFNTEVQPIPELMRLLNPKGANEGTFYIYDTYSLEITQIRGFRSEAENKYRRAIRELKKAIKEEYDIVLNAENSIIVPKSEEKRKQVLESCPLLTFQSETYNNLIFTLKLPEELIVLRETADELKRREEEEELRIRIYLTEEIAKFEKPLRKNIHALATLDLFLAKANFAVEIGGIKPVILEKHEINLREGRHPKIEANLKEKDLSFTPITMTLREGVTCITGANMGGKTISLKLVGLLTLMGQFGLFVPADYMELGLQEYIVTSIGDMQSTDSGLSTFGGEIANVVEAMKYSDKKGLILIDELARGTNPQEGFAISFAIINYLRDSSSITLLTTHFDRITELEGIRHLQVVGLSQFDFDANTPHDVEDKLKILNKYMDYRLVEVSKHTEVPKDAINIARIMGLPESVVSNAEEIVKNGW